MKKMFFLLIGLGINTIFGSIFGAAIYEHPILEVVRNGDLQAVQEQIEDEPTSVNVRSSSGNTPLMLAAARGYEDMVRFLLVEGAVVNATNQGGWTALHYAADKSHEGIVQLLLEQGADVKARNRQNFIPLKYAVDHCDEENLDVVRRLVEHGSTLDIWAERRIFRMSPGFSNSPRRISPYVDSLNYPSAIELYIIHKAKYEISVKKTVQPPIQCIGLFKSNLVLMLGLARSSQVRLVRRDGINQYKEAKAQERIGSTSAFSVIVNQYS